MKIRKSLLAYVYIVVGLLTPCHALYADQCDDLFNKAHGIFVSAQEAVDQKDYSRAAQLYKEATEYYENVANMQNCRCPKISGASQNNANLCRERANTCQAVMKEYEAEVKIFEDYNRAKEKYTEGNTYAQSREWDKAIAVFEEAAQIWEGIGAATKSENGARALAAAKQARDAADLVRKYKQNQ